jgi:hypothetical protein
MHSDSCKIIVQEDDWATIRSLIYDDNGTYRDEVAGVETGPFQPFVVWLYMPEAQPLLDLLDEQQIKYRVGRPGVNTGLA